MISAHLSQNLVAMTISPIFTNSLSCLDMLTSKPPFISNNLVAVFDTIPFVGLFVLKVGYHGHRLSVTHRNVLAKFVANRSGVWCGEVVSPLPTGVGSPQRMFDFFS